jgi:hypothetical protein
MQMSENEQTWDDQAWQLYNRAGLMLVKFDVDRITSSLSWSSRCNWRSKYSGSRDLIHDSTSAPLIKDIVHTLIECDIPHILDVVTMSSLTLSHVQIRHADQQTTSYMPWHRDTYVDPHHGGWIGNVPAVHKLIIYPIDDDGVVRHQLDVIGRSHRMTVDDSTRDFDIMMSNGFEVIPVSSSNSSAVLFNTAAMHMAVPVTSPTGSLRIICSFTTRQQLERRFNNDPIHANINTLYRNMTCQQSSG